MGMMSHMIQFIKNINDERNIMELLSVVFTLALVGLLIWALITYVPMQPPFPMIIVAVAVIAAILWLLRIFGMGTPHIIVP